MTEGGPRYTLKIQTDAFEVNVWVSPEEVAKFGKKFYTVGKGRGSDRDVRGVTGILVRQ